MPRRFQTPFFKELVKVILQKFLVDVRFLLFRTLGELHWISSLHTVAFSREAQDSGDRKVCCVTRSSLSGGTSNEDAVFHKLMRKERNGFALQ